MRDFKNRKTRMLNDDIFLKFIKSPIISFFPKYIGKNFLSW